MSTQGFPSYVHGVGENVHSSPTAKSHAVTTDTTALAQVGMGWLAAIRIRRQSGVNPTTASVLGKSNGNWSTIGSEGTTAPMGIVNAQRHNTAKVWIG